MRQTAPHAATGLLNSGKDCTCPLSSRYVGPTPHQEETQRTSRLDPSASNTMYLGCMMFPWEQVRGTQTEHHIVPATNLPATTWSSSLSRTPCPSRHTRKLWFKWQNKNKKHLHQELCESVTEGDNTKMGALEPAGESLGSFQGRGVCSQGENRAGLLCFLTAIP